MRITVTERSYRCPVAITVRGYAYRCRRLKFLRLQQMIALDEPIEDGALRLGPGKFIFESLVLLGFGKVPLKGNNVHTTAFQERHVRNDRQKIGVNVHLELGFEVKAVFMEEPGVDGVTACQALDLRSVQDKPLTRLADVDDTHSSQAGYVLAGIPAVDVSFQTDGLRSGGTAVIAHDSKHALTKCAFAVARLRTIQYKEAFAQYERERRPGISPASRTMYLGVFNKHLFQRLVK